MYSWGKLPRGEKPRKQPTKTHFFPSSLLDGILRSINGDDEEERYEEDYRLKKEKSSRFQTSSIQDEEEEMASLRRACLMEKIMEKKINDKVCSRRKPSSLLENDRGSVFFSLDSPDSSNTDHSSSLDEEFFSSTTKSRTFCFASRPSEKTKKPHVRSHQLAADPSCYQQSSEFYSIKPKSMASKIYSHLKKVKQPISPGIRLTNFISSIFANGNEKKTKNVSKNGVSRSKSTMESNHSPANSFSRSCLSKSRGVTSQVQNNKQVSETGVAGLSSGGVRRTVRFHPVSIILGEDSRPCGHKSIYNEDFDIFRRSHSTRSLSPMEKYDVITSYEKIEEGEPEISKGYLNQNKDNDNNVGMERIIREPVANYGIEGDEDDDDDDEDSEYSSSDLFEIDHLSHLRNNDFVDELPLYETTHLDSNRAIATGD